MKRILRPAVLTSLLILLIVVLYAGCAISPSATAQQPAGTPNPSTSSPVAGGQNADLLVKLSTNPNPPIRGNNTLEAFVGDAQGNPISNAKISFDIDMTNMSHGKNVVAASPSGEGRYRGTVAFLMPGPWRVIVNIERAGRIDTVRFNITVNFR